MPGRFMGVLATAAIAGAAVFVAGVAPLANAASSCRTPTGVDDETACPFTIEVHVSQADMANDPASQTAATAACSRGTLLTGGGLLADSLGGAMPSNGLRVGGSFPSTPGGGFANGSHDPSAWSAIGNFGGQSQPGDQIKAYVLCGGGLQHTLVVRKTVAGPRRPATDETVTVTCPAGTTLLGGGGSTAPITDPSLKLIGSYPSTAAGAEVQPGSANPSSWSAVGAAGGMRFGSGQPTTTVYALCGQGTRVSTVVARVDSEGHPAGPGNLDPGSDPFAIATATCPAGDTVISGGVLADGNPSDAVGVPQQGVHVRGSYPSDAKGMPLTDAVEQPSSWTVIVQSGGQPTPGTNTHAFALCAS